jgi:hypothetical protein
MDAPPEASTSFLAIYRGKSISTARIIAVSADPILVREVAAILLEEPAPADPDPVTRAVALGRRHGLRLIAREGAHGAR